MELRTTASTWQTREEGVSRSPSCHPRRSGAATRLCFSSLQSVQQPRAEALQMSQQLEAGSRTTGSVRRLRLGEHTTTPPRALGTRLPVAGGTPDADLISQCLELGHGVQRLGWGRAEGSPATPASRVHHRKVSGDVPPRNMRATRLGHTTRSASRLTMTRWQRKAVRLRQPCGACNENSRCTALLLRGERC